MKYTDLGFKIEDILEGNPVTLPDGFRLKEPMTDQQIYEECWLVFEDRERYNSDTTIDTENDLEPLRLQYMVGLGLSFMLRDSLPPNPEFRKLDLAERMKFYERANNAVAWLTENMDPVMAITTGKVMITIHQLPFDTVHMPAFDNFAKKFKTLIMDCGDHVSREFKEEQRRRIAGA